MRKTFCPLSLRSQAVIVQGSLVDWLVGFSVVQLAILDVDCVHNYDNTLAHCTCVDSRDCNP